MTVMMHDYRVMNPERGFVCLNELDFGFPFLPPMTTIFRVKVPRLDTVRQMMLESQRYPGPEALTAGLVDAVGGLDETLKFVEERKLVDKARSAAYGQIKEELYREIVADLDYFDRTAKQDQTKQAEDSRRTEEAKGRVDRWQKSRL